MINILIAEDHALVREGIKRIIEPCDKISVVGEVADGNFLLAKAAKENFDIILLDISMPGPGFMETMRRLQIIDKQFKILILSMHPEEQYAIRALKAGADGYLTKNHSPEELIAAIIKLKNGGRYISPTLAEQLVDELTVEKREHLKHECLSTREYQILCMLSIGIKTTEIGVKLSLSPKTISTYKSRIFEKMGFKNNAELILYALKNNLTN